MHLARVTLVATAIVTWSGSFQAQQAPLCTRTTWPARPTEFHRLHELLPVALPVTDDGSGTVEFRAGQVATFSIGILVPRPASAPPLAAGMPPILAPTQQVRTSLQILAKHGERLTTLCSGEMDAGRPDGEFLVRSDLPVQSLVVRYATNATLPRGARLLLRARSTLETAGELFPMRCAEPDLTALADRFDLTPVRREVLGGARCRTRLHWRSAEDLLVSVTTGRPSAAGTSAQITSFFKPANTHLPFTTQCTAPLNDAPGAVVRFMVGSHPGLALLGDDGERLWALDLDSDCEHPGQFELQVHEIVPKVRVGRRSTAVPVSQDYGVPPILTDLRLACFGDLRSQRVLDAQRLRPRPSVPTKTFLDLSVMRRSGELVPSERAHVERAALYALAAWSSACLGCGPRALSLAQVNGKFFGTSLLVEELVGTQPPGTRLLPPGSSPTQQLAAAMNARVSAYLPLTPADLRRLCGSPLLKEVLGERATCSQGVPQSRNEKAALRILLTDGFTACDSDENTIACEQHGRQIEFNTRDFAFSVADGGEVAFGTGERSVPLDLVLAHEIGHWLGVGHVTSLGALMEDNASSARCISDADLEALRARNEGRAPPMPPRNTLKFR